MKTETLILSGWRLNAARILSKLADVVQEHSGMIVDAWPFVSPTRIYAVKDENLPGAPTLYLKAITYLHYAVGQLVVYVELNDNPFFNPVYTKEWLDSNDCTVSAHQDALPVSWDWCKTEDSYRHMTDEEVTENAKALYEWLNNAPVTVQRASKNRRKIQERRFD